MKCPYCNCNGNDCVPNVVYTHAENYGGGISNFNCEKCGKVVQADVERIVKIRSLKTTVERIVKIRSLKTTTEESDW